MELIAIVCVLAALVFGTLWLRSRSRHRELEGRVKRVEEINGEQAMRISQLNLQSAEDGNRLSELRSQNRDLVKLRDEIAATNAGLADRNGQLLSQLHESNAKLLSAEAKIADLQPLADKAIAAHQQRVAASRKAAANRTAASKANGKAPGKAGVKRPAKTKAGAR